MQISKYKIINIYIIHFWKYKYTYANRETYYDFLSMRTYIFLKFILYIDLMSNYKNT